MKKFKVVVKGLEQCIAAQKALFEMGHGWMFGGQTIMQYAETTEIYVRDGKMTQDGGYPNEGSGVTKELLLTVDGKLVDPATTQAPQAVRERQVALSRGTDPATSKAAGMSFDPTQLELEVLNAIRSFGTDGATQDDVLTKLRRISHSSITPRFRPLLNKGLVVDTGLKRKGVSGRGQRVMMAAA